LTNGSRRCGTVPTLAHRNFSEAPMPETTCHMSISLDGFVAGPEQSREDPLGKGGREVHGWHLGDERANEADATAEGWLMRPRGAYVMGRNMFGPVRGEWDEDWDGWWGPEPPYHAPVFVLTHHPREPVEMFDGVESFGFEPVETLHSPFATHIRYRRS
jgi:dihydrofolate reductase